jgi:putative SOS response-associated peptidase YedK
MEWGLIPHWAQSEEKALQIKRYTYNARDDTVFEKPSFRDAILRNRCLVIADGWFEWHHRGGRKYPYYIQLADGKPFAMAGIWSEWKFSGRSWHTFSIVTTEANPMMAEIHNSKMRMPVILPPERERTWLDRTLPRQEIAKLMRPYDEKLMRAHTVSKLVSTPGADKNVPAATEPFSYPELSGRGSQTTLF